MRKRIGNWALFLCFAAVTGMLIACAVWLYLKIANVGITLIWEIIPDYIDEKLYTLILCVVGGLVIGIFQHFFGPVPESMKDSVKRVKTSGTYPVEKMPLILIGSFLSLFFGGTVGPESGLVCLLLGACCWAMSQFGFARWRMEALLSGETQIRTPRVFREMLHCLRVPMKEIEYDKDEIVWTRAEQISAGVAAGLIGLFIYELLNALFGRGLAVPHLADRELYARDKVGAILFIAVGIAAGYLFLFFKKVTSCVFQAMKRKHLEVLNAVLGGLILGLIGSALPMTMFSGGNDIQAIQYEYLQYTPFLLILIGVVKLFLTNVCIESGWRGGHFFPVIFSGLSIGYGFSLLLDTNQIFSVVLVTGALLGTMLQQPIGAIALSVIFFPIEDLGWMILASAMGGCLPLPKPLREAPEQKGFVYSMISRRRAKGAKKEKAEADLGEKIEK